MSAGVDISEARLVEGLRGLMDAIPRGVTEALRQVLNHPGEDSGPLRAAVAALKELHGPLECIGEFVFMMLDAHDEAMGQEKTVH